MSHPILAAALDYARKGIRIFPLIPGTKLPLWKDYFNRATCDETAIRSWYSDDQRPPNIAFEPGANGYTVIDVDDKHGHSGSASWAAICLEDGLDPDTLTAGTPSGGSHLYYKDAVGLRPSVSKLGDGLDIRSRGGYVLLPPSVVEGVAYWWKRNTDIKPISAAIYDRLAVKENSIETSKIDAADLDSEISVGRARVYLQQAFDTEGRWGELDPPDTYTIAQKAKDLGLSQETCLDLMMEWLTEDEREWMAFTLRNVYKYGQNEAGATAIVPGSQLWTPEHVLRCTDEAERKGYDAARERWRPLRPSEAIAMPPPEWWDDQHLFPKLRTGATGMIFGPAARHKSGVVLAHLFTQWKKYGDDFKVAMAIGEDRDIIGMRLRAHMLANGMTADELDRRLLMMAIPYVMVPEETLSVAHWLNHYEAFRPDVFIIDTFATALQGADEDTRAGATLTERGNLGVLARELRTFPLVVHHTGHEGAKARGSSSFEGNVSVYASIGIGPEKDSQGRRKAEPENPDAVSLHVIKTKGGKGGSRFFYEIRDVGGVAVPQTTTRSVYNVLTGSDQFSDKMVLAALDKLGANSKERGVSSLNLLRTMHPRPEETEPEHWDSLLAGLSQKLERRAGDGTLRGFNNKQDGGNPVLWFTRPAG